MGLELKLLKSNEKVLDRLSENPAIAINYLLNNKNKFLDSSYRENDKEFKDCFDLLRYFYRSKIFDFCFKVNEIYEELFAIRQRKEIEGFTNEELSRDIFYLQKLRYDLEFDIKSFDIPNSEIIEFFKEELKTFEYDSYNLYIKDILDDNDKDYHILQFPDIILDPEGIEYFAENYIYSLECKYN